jgi:hypothetical protein
LEVLVEKATPGEEFQTPSEKLQNTLIGNTNSGDDHRRRGDTEEDYESTSTNGTQGTREEKRNTVGNPPQQQRVAHEISQ